MLSIRRMMMGDIDNMKEWNEIFTQTYNNVDNINETIAELSKVNKIIIMVFINNLDADDNYNLQIKNLQFNNQNLLYYVTANMNSAYPYKQVLFNIEKMNNNRFFAMGWISNAIKFVDSNNGQQLNTYVYSATYSENNEFKLILSKATNVEVHIYGK